MFGHLYLPIKVLKAARQSLHIRACVFMCIHIYTPVHA